MYTVEIGRQFLDLYNRKTGNDYTALEFFEEEFFPVVFDAEDHLHLMHVHGSSFFQPAYSRLAEKEDISVPEYRKQKFLESVEEVKAGEINPHGGVGVGFMAGGVEETTSGQVSSIDFDLTEENILYSWIGGALGVGFGGGYDFLFQNDEVNWFLFEGWKYYRKFLTENKAKGRQIETWNGLWICFGLQYIDNLDRVYREIHANLDSHSKTRSGLLRLDRPEWIKQVFSLAKYFDGKKSRELIYGYGYGQMNTTLGFMYLELANVASMADLFDSLIKDDPELSRSEKTRIEKVYETHFSLEQACTQGGIGVRAIQPKDLKKYTVWTNNKNVKSPKLDKKEDRITFFTYITWIQAMLQNDETLQLADEVAEALIKYEGEEERLRTRITKVEELWESTSRQQLIDKLSEVVKEEPKVAETINVAVNQLMTEIPQDMYKLFLTLIKFKYQYYRSN